MQTPGQVQQGSGEGLGGFGAEPGQVQQSGRVWCSQVKFNSVSERRFRSGDGSGEGSGEGLGDVGAESRQVQQGSGEGSGEGCGEGSGEGCGEGSGQALGAEPGQVQQRSGEGSGLVRPGSTRLQVGSGAIPGVCRRSFSFGRSSKFRTKNAKIIYCCCWGYRRSLIFVFLMEKQTKKQNTNQKNIPKTKENKPNMGLFFFGLFFLFFLAGFQSNDAFCVITIHILHQFFAPTSLPQLSASPFVRIHLNLD